MLFNVLCVFLVGESYRVEGLTLCYLYKHPSEQRGTNGASHACTSGTTELPRCVTPGGLQPGHDIPLWANVQVRVILLHWKNSLRVIVAIIIGGSDRNSCHLWVLCFRLLCSDGTMSVHFTCCFENDLVVQNREIIQVQVQGQLGSKRAPFFRRFSLFSQPGKDAQVGLCFVLSCSLGYDGSLTMGVTSELSYSIA